ncbi:MAG TPA: LuxR C-terminal-related transcriptional regulator [Gemmatimonadaceae bacterium]|nr:LuxR C-terminal-related transcriptional regulator [Gemmatimonadaceae bacterium]
MRSTAEMAVPAPARNSLLRVVPSAHHRTAPVAPSAPSGPGLFTALEAMEQAIAVFSFTGTMLRQAAPFERMLAQAEDRAVLLRLIRAVVTRVAECGAMPRQWKTGPCAVCLREGVLTVRGAVYQPGDDPMVLVHVTREQGAPRQMSDSEIVGCYRLTAMELRVALLLADGNSNKKIAATLGVSGHTARHHTEHVLRKLGIHSRNEVARRLHEPRVVRDG